MSDTPQGPGWWQASDGRYYPPEAAPGAVPTPPPVVPTPPPGAVPTPPPGIDPTVAFSVPTPAPGAVPTPAPAPAPGAVPPGGLPPGGYPPGPPTYPPAGPPPKKRSMLLPILAVIALLAVVGAAIAVITTRGGDGDDAADSTTTSTTEAPPDVDPVLLQNVDDPGPNPFGTSFSSVTLPAVAAAASDHAADLRGGLAAAGSGALLASGSTPGLYGGSRDDQVCDALAIADFLDGEPDKAAAFAEVLSVPVGSVRQYLTGLTPVILVNDTWVTNHGFADGTATPFPAVLQAGTAVLVDGRGTPRVRCSCGNPLTEPTVEGYDTTVTDGDAWDDYDAEQVTVVEPGDELDTITVVDVTSGEEFERLLGAGRTGEVQVTLRWQGDADLDLHVTDPTGAEIYFANKFGPNGGELDVDVIPGCGAEPADHTENVFFESDAPVGTYTIVINSYTGCGVPEPFELQVVVAGEVVLSESGSVPSNEESPPFTFVR